MLIRSKEKKLIDLVRTSGWGLHAIILICITTPYLHAESLLVRSPDSKNAIEVFGIGEDQHSLGIRISRGGRAALEISDIEVGLIERGELTGSAVLHSVTKDSVDEVFLLPWGKTRQVVNRCERTTAKLIDSHEIEWEVDLVAFDDGVAYRYRLSKQQKLDSFTLTKEFGNVRFAGVPTVHYSCLNRFTTDHEAEFHRDELTGVMGPLIDLPLLAVWPDGLALGVTEARIRDFPNLYWEPSSDPDSELFHTRLSPLPSRDDACVVGQPPITSPWRVVLLGDKAGELLESNLLVCLNDPPSGDFSWAKPGKTTWHWWNGTFDRGPSQVPGMNLQTHKRYIDFCAEYGISYHAVVSDRHPWHVQSAEGFSPQPDTDILTPRPGLELPKILQYARERGVGIRLWLHWKALDKKLEEAFDRYEKWGISGLMIDFLDRDDQEMVRFCERVLAAAARHRLHIQFHGSYKPSGEHRTFPHLFNREGVLNLEYLKWSKRCTPPHNVEAAYVRQLAGPLDYHTGGFHSVSNAGFVARNENPFVLGTRAHHLAMYVVYENPMPMVCDSPETYEGQAGLDFISQVPVSWDESRYVDGMPGDYIVMARRRGATWYLGGMTNWTPREVDLSLDFLSPGTYESRLYVDDSMSQNEPNALRRKSQTIQAGELLKITMAPGGGFTAVLTSQRPLEE